MTEPLEEEVDDDSDADYKEFFFESDHLALRGNADYTSVLRTIAILQAQRIQVTKDIDLLAAAEKNALDDPDEFVKQLAAGNLQMPGLITAVELPKINFEKYGVSIPDFVEDEPKAVDATDMTVRGRLFDQTKPETFNQLWTCDEQKRLEELLIEYPPEPIEMRRFAKIARALGNRTKRQVASRLQKYFKKLHSAGMPVPGRIPKSHRINTARLARINKQALRPTTFFPANHVPFAITEDDCGGVSLDPNWYRQGCSAFSENSNSNEAGTSGRRTYVVDDGDSDSADVKEQPQEALMLRLLERLKRDKEKDRKSERHYCEHNGYKCDVCADEPIVGTRWHCTVCITSVDFCSDCLLTQLTSDTVHPLEHKLIALRVSSVNTVSSRLASDNSDDDDDDEDPDDEQEDLNDDYEVAGSSSNNPKNSQQNSRYSEMVFDKDYVPQKYGGSSDHYNYLDPNFLPK